jgi:uncharacterized membrane protein
MTKTKSLVAGVTGLALLGAVMSTPARAEPVTLGVVAVGVVMTIVGFVIGNAAGKR